MQSCCFDLETSSLNGNFGIILCACIKPWRGKIKILRGDDYKNWKKKRSDDYRLAKDIYNELKKYDIWIAHNGVKFDVPFLRTRLMRRRFQVPPFKIVDPVKLARRHLRMGYNSLEQIASHLGYEGKTRVDSKHWLRASLDGSSTSLNYIVKHCAIDVDLLEKVADAVRPYVPRVNTWGSDT